MFIIEPRFIRGAPLLLSSRETHAKYLKPIESMLPLNIQKIKGYEFAKLSRHDVLGGSRTE